MERTTLRRWIPLAAVVALLGAAMLASAYANPTIPNLPRGAPPTVGPDRDRPQPEAVAPTETVPPQPDPGTLLPAWVGWVLSALCLAAILVVVAMLLWFLVRDRLAQLAPRRIREQADLPTVAETQRQVRAAVDEGLAELDDADGDPRRAVIACWVRLERAAAAAGTLRQPGDTSTDLVSRLLADHLVSGEVLASFAAIYREARFARHTVDVAMREEARSALRQLRYELSSGAVR